MLSKVITRQLGQRHVSSAEGSYHFTDGREAEENQKILREAIM